MDELTRPWHPDSSRVWLAGASSIDWWNCYRARLVDQMVPTSLEVLSDDADFVVDRCVLLPDRSGDAHWGQSRERSGAVMGAVQSGKTASMLGVIAKALDGGVDAVVLLAGTRSALWLQTWERFRAQLDVLPDPRSRRHVLPSYDPVDVAAGAVPLGALYGMTDQLAARAVAKRLPIMAVVLKQVDHLQRLTSTLHDVVYPQVVNRGDPFHLLVVDDEADDSSIDEADLSSTAALQERQVPRRIVDLWESRRHPGETAVPNLRATYLAYTATPQANFLQDQANPLAPKDFVVSLRTPGADGDPDKRDASYRVHEGITAWYTGGDVFYRVLDDVPLCLPVDELEEDDRLLHGVRAFLVASAIRLSRAGLRSSRRGAIGDVFSSAEQAKDAGGPVASMLVHPSAVKDAHFETAGRLLAWSLGLEAADGPLLLAEGVRHLGTTGVAADMEADTGRWQAWLQDYTRSMVAVSQLPGGSIADCPDWEETRRLILEEVVPSTTVAVINSDVRADDRPSFEPVQVVDGWRTAPNLSTIFVSGNVMSRGLTLDGLITTVFTRSSDDPAADTQMQMQRWFGYRGSYIDLCRVLMSAAQIDLFRQYHDTDLALRMQVLSAMSSDSPASPTVLQGKSFKATGKISNLGSQELWPGPDPFMTYLNQPDDDQSNQELVAAVFAEESLGVPDEQGAQGRLLERTLSLEETAELLERLRYPTTNVGGVDPAALSRSETVQRIARIVEGDHFFPIFRSPPDTDAGAWGVDSPFSVAAYLRFWAMCLEERLPAAFTTDDPPLLWSLLDLDSRIEAQPRFRVGIRFGSGPPVTAGPLADLPWAVRAMDRNVEDSRLQARWGARNYRDGVLWGDEFFDCYRSGHLPTLTPSRARARGADGLLLFHVIRHGGGVAVAPALSIPVGGPDQVHAKPRRPGGS